MKKRKVKLFASIASLGLVVAVMGVGVWAATQQAVRVSSEVSFTATSIAADITLQVTNNTELVGADATYNQKMDIVEYATLSTANKDGKYLPNDDLNLIDKVTLEGEEQYIARFNNDTEKTLYQNNVYLKIADKDEDGYLNKGAQIVYTFTIDVPETSANVYYDMYANLHHTRLGSTKYYIDEIFDVQISDNEVNSKATTINGQSVQYLTNWAGEGTEPGEGSSEVIEAGSVDESARIITVTYTVKDLGTDYQGISFGMASLQLGDIFIKMANSRTNLGTIPNHFDADPNWTDYTTVDATQPKGTDPNGPAGE